MKRPSDVLGVKIGCPNFEKCPLCFGCRNYRQDDIQCEECAKNKKKNICNVELHKPDLIAKFITKDKILINTSIKPKEIIVTQEIY